MADIVGVRFKRAGKVYYFDPADIELEVNDYVVVKTTHGLEMGQVVIAPKQVLASDVNAPLKTVVRKAEPEDIERAQEFQGMEEEALAECAKLITKLQLPMKLLSAQYNLDGSRLTFFFSAAERVDFRELVRELQSHGIRVLGSTIVGLEEHTPENIDDAIDYAVSHDTEFHQFMLYMPMPGTPLYAEHKATGTLLDAGEFPEADTHGQYKFNYRHAHIQDGRETEFLLRAFWRDFEVNGPSVVRLARTMLQGWKRYKDHPDRRIRDQFAWYPRGLGTTYAAALWAARHWFRGEPAMAKKISHTL